MQIPTLSLQLTPTAVRRELRYTLIRLRPLGWGKPYVTVFEALLKSCDGHIIDEGKLRDALEDAEAELVSELRGKGLNAESEWLAKVLENKGRASLVTAPGGGSGEGAATGRQVFHEHHDGLLGFSAKAHDRIIDVIAGCHAATRAVHLQNHGRYVFVASCAIEAVLNHGHGVGAAAAEVGGLFQLPLHELLFRAHSIHRQHFDPAEVQVSTLMLSLIHISEPTRPY